MGGKVTVNRTKWYLLEFRRDKVEIWRLANKEAEIFLQTPEGSKKIEQLPQSEALRILGFWIALNGYSIQQKGMRRESTF